MAGIINLLPKGKMFTSCSFSALNRCMFPNNNIYILCLRHDTSDLTVMCALGVRSQERRADHGQMEVMEINAQEKFTVTLHTQV